MAIQRMYSGRGGAVEFDKPAITPTEISQQYGRSMTDILKYKQTMQQRRKENILKLTDVGVTKGLMGEAQTRQSERMEAFRKKSVDVLMGEEDRYDPSASAMMEIQAEKNRVAQEGDRELRVQQEFIKAQHLMAVDATSTQPKYDQEKYTEAVKYYRENEGAYPPGGFITPVEFNLDQIYWDVLNEIKTEDGVPKPGEIGKWDVLKRKRVYKEADIMNQASFLWGTPRIKEKLIEQKGINSLEELVEKIKGDLPDLTEKVTHARIIKEKEDISKISSKENIIIDKGSPYTVTGASGTEGKGSFDISKSWSVNYKGKAPELRVDADSYIVQSGKKANEEGLVAGQTVAQAKIEASDRTYEVEKQEIQKRRIYEGEDIKVVLRKRKPFGGKERKWARDLKQTIKGGDPISNEVWAAMTPEQRNRSSFAPVVVSHLKDAVYGTFTILDKLDSRMANELGLSPEFMREIGGQGETKVLTNRTREEYVGMGYSEEQIDNAIKEGKIILK